MGVINIGKAVWDEDGLPLLLDSNEVRYNASY
jgi:hypothetical protein